jgi:DNA polymerase-3 subunit alpha
LEVNCQHENFARYKDILKPDTIIIIEGEVSEREGYDHPIGRLRKAFTMNDIRSRRTEAISLTLNKQTFTADIAKRLQKILPAFINETATEQRRVPLQFQIDHTYSKATISLGEHWYVRPEDELLKQLRENFGKNTVNVQYQRKTQATEVRTG